MADLRTSPDGAISNGDDSFLQPAAIRQPADALGPRAQRTIARIVEATRDVFLTRGYSGTTIDEIARIADVSRASFYTYFPSKREVLLAVGANSSTEGDARIERLANEGTAFDGLRSWVADYFDFLDVHGSFAFAWTQAAQEDEEIRIAGMKRHLRTCQLFGRVLTEIGGAQPADHKVVGLVASSLLERGWQYAHLYTGTVQRDAVIEQSARVLWAMAHPSPPG